MPVDSKIKSRSTLMHRRSWMAKSGSLALCTLCGCQLVRANAPQFALVSGMVRLDQQPLANARVLFVPIRLRDKNGVYLPVSCGVTDDHGRFELMVVRETAGEKTRKGAVVGRHRVWISRREDLQNTDQASEEKLPPHKLENEIVPDRYNGQTELTFDVPPGGTNDANFDLAGN